MDTSSDRNTRTVTSSPPSSPTPAPDGDEVPVPRARRLLCLGAALATLPYIALKIAWLAGSRVGIGDPSFGDDTAIQVANAITLALDVAALALAGVLGTRRGRRAPGWTVVLPLWVGAGLLGEILMLLPLTFVAGTVGSRPSSGPGPVEDWVYVLVYAGFAGLGLCLLPAFVGYVWQRWADQLVLRAPARPVAHRSPTWCGAAAAALVGVSWTAATVIGGDGGRWMFVDGAMALLAAAGLLTLRRGTRRIPRVVPAVAALTGTGGLFAWGLFHVAAAAGTGTGELTGSTAAAATYSLARLLVGLTGGVVLLRTFSSR